MRVKNTLISGILLLFLLFCVGCRAGQTNEQKNVSTESSAAGNTAEGPDENVGDGAVSDSVKSGDSTSVSASAASGDSTSVSTNSDSDAGIPERVDWNQLEKIGQMELAYADQFSVDYYQEGYSLVEIVDGRNYLLIPEGKVVPDNLPDGITTIQLPVSNIYLAASSAMDLFRAADALSSVSMTGTKAADWSLPEIRSLVESKEILYTGKYSAPDYEQILTRGCDLVIESTMIYHSPEVLEQLESLGLAVMVERSSYESEPLGRVEWIRLYGLMTGHAKEADEFMQAAISQVESLMSVETSGNSEEKTDDTQNHPKVAFFYISSAGMANVRKPGDYISKMITTAGGRYAFADIIPEEENSLSTMNLQMEVFCNEARDADILIYNSTVDKELENLQELLEKAPVLADFKAVQNGNVWCTGKNMYQETSGISDLMEDFFHVINGDVTDEITGETGEETSGELTYLYRLE